MANAPTVATYTNDPANTTLDRVRLEIGDTNCAEANLTDAEIKLYIDEEPSVLRAAARAAGAIAAKMATRIDYRHGSVSKSASQLMEHYRDLERALGARANLASVAPVALGVTIAEKEAAAEDDSRVQPSFQKGMHDNPRSGPTRLSEPNESTPL